MGGDYKNESQRQTVKDRQKKLKEKRKSRRRRQGYLVPGVESSAMWTITVTKSYVANTELTPTLA